MEAVPRMQIASSLCCASDKATKKEGSRKEPWGSHRRSEKGESRMEIWSEMLWALERYAAAASGMRSCSSATVESSRGRREPGSGELQELSRSSVSYFER
jgi:hypothetical protein